MSLAEREARFQSLTSKFECKLVSGLIAAHKIKPHLLEKIQVAASNYMMKCFSKPEAITKSLVANSDSLLMEFGNQMSQIKNVTPNGLIVPKRETILEYNAFVSAFAEIIDSLNIVDFIDCWLYPPSLRFKSALFESDLLKRNYQSEHRHSEAWIPINTSKCISVFIPILGDAEKNGVEFFTPPKDFDESWLTPQSSYKAGEEIADRFSRLEMPYRIGELYLADAATLHVTSRKPGSGPRASIDINFLPKGASSEADRANLRDRPQPQTLSQVGKTKLFVFFDSVNEFIDTKGATLHPAARSKLIDL
jgi:hypothetical protein